MKRRQLLGRAGKYLTIHLDENLNVCDFNSAVAEAYLDTVTQTIRLAKELGAPILNMHLHDAKGTQCHLPLGDGEVDITHKLALAGAHNCRCVLEVKTVEGLRKSVEFIHKRRLPA